MVFRSTCILKDAFAKTSQAIFVSMAEIYGSRCKVDDEILKVANTDLKDTENISFHKTNVII
jgi:hypothetical protein